MTRLEKLKSLCAAASVPFPNDSWAAKSKFHEECYKSVPALLALVEQMASAILLVPIEVSGEGRYCVPRPIAVEDALIAFAQWNENDAAQLPLENEYMITKATCDYALCEVFDNFYAGVIDKEDNHDN